MLTKVSLRVTPSERGCRVIDRTGGNLPTTVKNETGAILPTPSVELVLTQAMARGSNGVHQYLLESAHGGVEAWLAALDKVAGLQPRAGVAATPESDPVRVDGGLALQEGDRPAPVGNLHPRVDVVARRSVAGAEATVVVHQHDKPGGGEHLGEALQTVLLHTGEPVGHRDGRMGTGAVGYKQPAPQNDIAFGGELDALSLNHPSLLPGACKRHNIDIGRAGAEEETPR